jgi:hypothetical protein
MIEIHLSPLDMAHLIDGETVPFKGDGATDDVLLFGCAPDWKEGE